jgi:16S rRNA (adenine1518-N6/adenine1519-N6)-dimethyltransferase
MGKTGSKSLYPWQGLDIPRLLKSFGIEPKKSLGQSFLICDSVADGIVKAASVGNVVIEIGPGTGILTARLAQSFDKVLAVEVDQRLKPLHETVAKYFPHVEFVYEDFLKWEPLNADAVVGNLPYYITTPILEKVFFQIRPKLMIFMVQKELAARMVAKPGSKSYGALSVFVQSFTQPSLLFHVKHSCFYPTPKVDSSVLKLVGTYESDVDPHVLEKLVKTAFQQRRKMLKNSVGGHPKLLEKAEEAGINTSLRPEQITVQQYNRWASLLTDQNTI